MPELSDLQPYLDDEGRLKLLPRQPSLRRLALEFLVTEFEFGRDYTEREVNTLLMTLHTFNDPALLRRELFEAGLLNRDKNGARYWRATARFL